MEDVQEYIAGLRASVAEIAAEKGVPPRQEFVEYGFDLLHAQGFVEELDWTPYTVRGVEVLSAFGRAMDGSILDIYVAIWRGEDRPTSLSDTDLGKTLDRVRSFISAASDGKLEDRVGDDDPVRDVVRTIVDDRNEIDRIRVFVLADAVARTERPANEEVAGFEVQFEVWDARRLARAQSAGGYGEELIVDFNELAAGPLPVLAAPGVAASYSAYLLLVPGDVLYRVYDRFSARLLEANVRSFLQLKGKVNKGIRETIRDEPDRFLAFNNGLTATAKDVELVDLPDGRKGISRITNLQIVNGGQTTASIYHVGRKEKADLSQIHVQMKLTQVVEDEFDRLVPQIARYANTQNKVTEADLASNHPFHRKIEELSRSTWMPATEGEISTRWFFERARGQYANAKTAAGTPARQKRFSAENPSRQKFDKTALAVWEMAWLQQPDMVCRGAQKNFVAFMETISANGLTNPGDDYYRKLIGKAVLFKSIEKIIDAQGEKGYRRNVVAYTMAWLSRKTQQRIDLMRIYEQQGISPLLAEVLDEASRVIRSLILDAPGSGNVGEWTKKRALWDRVLDEVNVDLTPLESELVALGKSGGMKTTAALPVDESAQEDIEWCGARPADDWFSLSNWAKQTGNFQGWERSMLFTVGKFVKQGRPVSVKQARRARPLMERAKSLGWTPEPES